MSKLADGCEIIACPQCEGAGEYRLFDSYDYEWSVMRCFVCNGVGQVVARIVAEVPE